jgi:hypothetical protein
MWVKYELGKPRPINIPLELYKAIEKYKERTFVQSAEIFDTALLRLWNKWNGNTHTNEPANKEIIRIVEDTLRFNPPPRSNGSKSIWIAFKGEQTFRWVQILEHDYAIVRCTEDFIRRVLSWFLREEGYLKKL